MEKDRKFILDTLLNGKELPSFYSRASMEGYFGKLDVESNLTANALVLF